MSSNGGALTDLEQQDLSWINESALVISDDDLGFVINNDSKSNGESDGMSSQDMITIITTILVPLVFGVIVVVGKYKIDSGSAK